MKINNDKKSIEKSNARLPFNLAYDNMEFLPISFIHVSLYFNQCVSRNITYMFIFYSGSAVNLIGYLSWIHRTLFRNKLNTKSHIQRIRDPLQQGNVRISGAVLHAADVCLTGP